MSAEGGIPIPNPIELIQNNSVDHSSKVGQVAKLTSGKTTLQTSATALDGFGIITKGAEADGFDSIAPFTSAVKTRVKLAASPGTINRGTRLASHTDGTLKAATSGDAECAIADEIGTSKGGALIYAHLMVPVLKA